MLRYNLTIYMPAWLDKTLIAPLLLARWLWYGYSFRRIPLTRGKYAIVDPEDYARLIKYKWCVNGRTGKYYAIRSYGPQNKRKMIYMHRFIMNAPKSKLIDHVNGNGLDNRKANLRFTTIAQNNYNTQPHKNSSKYKGVSFKNGRNCWRARIGFNRRKISLGVFKEEIEAARAYDSAAKKYYGQYACLNFPQTKPKGLKFILQRAFKNPLSNPRTRTST